jgi:hypothetical protein
MNIKTINQSGGLLLTAVFIVGICGPAPAMAGSVGLSVSLQSVLAAPGSNGDSFEVDVKNNATTTDVIDSFYFELSSASSNIVFTSATIGTTNPYIFDVADSLFGPTISTTPPPDGQTVIASDIWAGAGNGYSLAAGATVAIGEVFFNVQPGAAAGPDTVSFSPTSGTSFSDINTNLFNIQSLTSGNITVTGAATTPEPSTLATMGLALAALAFASRARRRKLA